MEMMRGKEKDAVKTYEKVLMLDANNLQANIFLGQDVLANIMKTGDKKKIVEIIKEKESNL